MNYSFSISILFLLQKDYTAQPLQAASSATDEQLISSTFAQEIRPQQRREREREKQASETEEQRRKKKGMNVTERGVNMKIQCHGKDEAGGTIDSLLVDNI